MSGTKFFKRISPIKVTIANSARLQALG